MYLEEGTEIAAGGTEALTAWWKKLPADVRNAIPATETAKLKKLAQGA